MVQNCFRGRNDEDFDGLNGVERRQRPVFQAFPPVVIERFVKATRLPTCGHSTENDGP